MGEQADMMLEGEVCQECGVFFSDDDWPGAETMSDGYPRYCRGCGGDPECNGARKKKRKH